MGAPYRRAGGSMVYATAGRGLLTSTDMYGPAVAAAPVPGIVAAAGGAYNAGSGTRVTAAPPTLRVGGSAGSGGSSVPVLGPLMDKVPGGGTVHLVLWLVLAFFLIRFTLKEVE